MEYELFPEQYRAEHEDTARSEMVKLSREQEDLKRRIDNENPSLIKRFKRKFGFYYLALVPFLMTVFISCAENCDGIVGLLIMGLLIVAILFYYRFPTMLTSRVNKKLSEETNDTTLKNDPKWLYRKLTDIKYVKKCWSLFVFIFGFFSRIIFYLHDDEEVIVTVSMFICIVLGIVFSIIRKRESKLQITYERKMAELEQKEKLLQDKINASNVYEQEFEDKAKLMSVQLMDSAVVDRIVDWLSEKYFKPIETADRKPYIENIKIPFLIQVFKNKIVTPSGVFDFVEECCQLLNSPLEQWAVCHAIAAKLDLQTHTRISEDPSGTPYTVEQQYGNDGEAAIVTLTYSAVNGNYKEAESFF